MRRYSLRLRSSLTSVRRSAGLAAIGAAIFAAAPLRAASIEFVGNNFPVGGVTSFKFEVLFNPAEMLFGTYSAAGGTMPSGATVAAGGMDAKLDLNTAAGTLLNTSDDINGAANRDSEIRTTGYPGGRVGATVRPPVPVGVYDLRLSRFGSGSGAWSTAIANSSGGVSLFGLTLAAGQTIDTVTSSGGGFLIFGGGNYAVTGQTVAEANSNVQLNGGSLTSDVRVNGSGAFTSYGGTLNANVITLGSSTGGQARFSTLDANANVNAGGIFLAVAANADALVQHTTGNVTATGVVLGTTAFVNEKSVYRLSGGTLAVFSINNDGTNNNTLELNGGTLRLQFPGNTNLVAGQSLIWTNGTLDFNGNADLLDLRRVFGTSMTLAAGQRLNVNGSDSWNSLITLDGGTLALAALPVNAPLDWNKGTLEFAFATAQVGAGQGLGTDLNLTAGKTVAAETLRVLASGSALVQPGGRIVGQTLDNRGDFRLGGAGAVVEVDQFQNTGGTLGGSGTIRGTLINSVTSEVSLAAGETLRVTGLAYSQGHVRLNGGTLDAGGDIENLGTLVGRGTLAADVLQNSGVATFSAGVSDIDAAVNNKAGGKLIVTGGATLTVYKNLTNVSGSEFRVSSDSRAVFLGTVTGLSSFTGSGTKYFEGPGGGGSLVNALGRSVVEPNGYLATNGIREASLVVRGGVAVAPGSPTSTLGELTFDGGTLDLADNRLILDYSTASPITLIRAALLEGALFSSGLPAGRGVGYAEAAAIAASSFGGLGVDATALLVRRTFYGDANLDGAVTFDDLLALAQNYGGPGGKVWSQGDSNYDGAVDFDDLLALAQNYGASAALTDQALAAAGADVGVGFAADWALARSLVPEPATLATLVAAAVPLAPRRRGRITDR